MRNGAAVFLPLEPPQSESDDGALAGSSSDDFPRSGEASETSSWRDRSGNIYAYILMRRGLALPPLGISANNARLISRRYDNLCTYP